MAVKYSFADKELFIQILENYKIIEDKRTDAFFIAKKKKAWEKITEEFNKVAEEKRTVLQLKRLWDKLKRSRKAELAEERKDMMATGGGPSKPPPAPQPNIDNVIPHIDFDLPIIDDSDGINLNKSEEVQEIVISGEPVVIASTFNEAQVFDDPSGESQHEEPQPKSMLGPITPRKIESSGYIKEKAKSMKAKAVDKLTEARLSLIEKEKEQMDELHKVRLEEANYRKEAARLVMVQEEIKLELLKKNIN